MSRMLLVALYFGAEVLDHSVGYLWQANLPGGSNQHGENGTNGTTNVSGGSPGCDTDDDIGSSDDGTYPRDSSWTFGWWRIRGTVEYIFGRNEAASEDRSRGDSETWFSTPEGTGRMGRDAGWIGYFIDSLGVSAFGSWWAYAAWTGIGAGAIILLGLLAYSLQTLLAPVRWVTTMLSYARGPISCCCRRSSDDTTPFPEGPPLARNVEWRGPATGWPAETRYLQEKVKGRGSRRRLNDVLVRVHGQVARLQQDESSQRRIDTHGLKVKFLGITGCTSRQFRRELEDVGEIHLCRQIECGVEHGMHVKEYAGVDREALLDLHQYANGSPRWLLGVLCRCFWTGGSLLFGFIRCLCCCGGGRRQRQLRRPDGGVRDLGPDSESEAEIDECSCQAVKVGVIQDGHMRPLAPHGCGDLACNEETILLDEDAAVSDIRPPAPGQNGVVSLCTHHRQLYLSASAKRKCGVLICYKAAKGARHGVPLCFDHLEEHGGGSATRRDSPHPKGLLNGFRRRFGRREAEAARSRSPGDAVERPGRDRKAPEKNPRRPNARHPEPNQPGLAVEASRRPQSHRPSRKRLDDQCGWSATVVESEEMPGIGSKCSEGSRERTSRWEVPGGWWLSLTTSAPAWPSTQTWLIAEALMEMRPTSGSCSRRSLRSATRSGLTWSVTGLKMTMWPDCRHGRAARSATENASMMRRGRILWRISDRGSGSTRRVVANPRYGQTIRQRVTLGLIGRSEGRRAVLVEPMLTSRVQGAAATASLEPWETRTRRRPPDLPRQGWSLPRLRMERCRTSSSSSTPMRSHASRDRMEQRRLGHWRWSMRLVPRHCSEC